MQGFNLENQCVQQQQQQQQREHVPGTPKQTQHFLHEKGDAGQLHCMELQ